jgi:hypothetical protein
MASRGMIILLISGVLALVGIILFAVSVGVMMEDVSETDDTDVLIFSGNTGDVELSIEHEYSVYASDSVSCNSIEVSVHDGTYEYFSKNCESYRTKDNLRYIGSISIDNSGTFNIESDAELRIYEQNSEDIEMTGLWVMILGEGVCCLSFIGIIIAIVFLIVDNNNKNVVTIIPNHQMIMPIEQSQKSYHENDLQN